MKTDMLGKEIYNETRINLHNSNIWNRNIMLKDWDYYISSLINMGINITEDF